MKRSKFSEEQVVGILREGAGMSVKAVCAKHNISEPTYYKWKKQYGGLEVSDVRTMRAMAEENARLKRIIADLVVQNDILKVVNAKKW
ncbi:MAG: transposase [Candidatus Methylacidiphilales bacterium]|nr:transposase [Candidatus Methylacidiphilales bacterium]